jgi:hypothetical protein
VAAYFFFPCCVFILFLFLFNLLSRGGSLVIWSARGFGSYLVRIMLFPVGLVAIPIGEPEMHEHGNLVQLRLLQLLNLEGSTVREGLAVFDFAVFEECRFECEAAHVFQRFLYHRQQDLSHKCGSVP